MITIDNDYMINERGYDLRANLKEHDNPSNIADIFLKQLSYRIYDFIIANSVNFNSRKQIDAYLEVDEERIEDFRRALAEQAVYLIVNGDPSVMMAPESVSQADWRSMRVSPATIDILKRLQFLRTVVSEEEYVYDCKSWKDIFDPTRNW